MHDHQGKWHEREQQPGPVDLLGVEERDDEDRPDVVRDRECREEHLQGVGNPRPQQGQHAQRERDVGRHRHAPARRARATGVQRDVDRRRNDHAADRGDNRQRGATKRGQLADDELTLDLESNDEEEDRHERVVDPVLERLLEAEVAHEEARQRMPELVVRGMESGVRYQESDHRCQRAAPARRWSPGAGSGGGCRRPARGHAVRLGTRQPLSPRPAPHRLRTTAPAP